MKTENEINNDILTISLIIEETFPELSKYIGEMPVNLSYIKGSETKVENLHDYFLSLDSLFTNYKVNHISAKQ